IPLGVVIPCGLAIYAFKGTPATVAGITGLVLPLVGIAGVLLMLGDRSNYKRSLALAKQADAMGFEFIEWPTREQYDRFGRLYLFRWHGGDPARNMLVRRDEGVKVTVLDFNSAVEATQTKRAYVQTVFVVSLDDTDLPPFVLNPHGWLTKAWAAL